MFRGGSRAPACAHSSFSALRPASSPIGAFNGTDASGTWTLTVNDDSAGDVGTLNEWSLKITY